MKLLIKVTVALVIIAALLGVGTQVGHQHGAIGKLPGQSLIIPQDAAAASISAPTPVKSGGYVQGRGYVSGVAVGTFWEVCLRLSNGTLFACRSGYTYTTNAVIYYSGSFAYTCGIGQTLRSEFYVAGYGWHYSYWVSWLC